MRLILFLLSFSLYIQAAFAVEFSQVQKGDRLTFSQEYRASEVLGRTALTFPKGFEFTVTHVGKEIASPAGRFPVVMRQLIRFSHQYVTNWDEEVTRDFDNRSFSNDFPWLEFAEE